MAAPLRILQAAQAAVGARVGVQHRLHEDKLLSLVPSLVSTDHCHLWFKLHQLSKIATQLWQQLTSMSTEYAA